MTDTRGRKDPATPTKLASPLLGPLPLLGLLVGLICRRVTDHETHFAAGYGGQKRATRVFSLTVTPCLAVPRRWWRPLEPPPCLKGPTSCCLRRWVGCLSPLGMCRAYELYAHEVLNKGEERDRAQLCGKNQFCRKRESN